MIRFPPLLKARLLQMALSLAFFAAIAIVIIVSLT